MFRFLTSISGFSIFGGKGGGKRRDNPLSTDIVVVTRKKMRSKKEMSAIELALIS